MLKRETITPKSGPKQDVYRGGKGPSLVWLHGISGLRPDEALLLELAKSFSVVAPVMPGRADLAELEDIRDIHDLALHYDNLLEQMGLDRVVLVGHSFGGMLAAEIAAHVPKRVSALALISPLGLWSDNAPVEDLFARPHALIDELLWRGAERKPQPKSPDAAPGDNVEAMVELANGLGSFAKFIWPIPDKGLRRRLYRIAAPTLVVFGEQDAYVPASYADEFVRGIAGARKLMLKGSHMIPFEQPEEIAAAIVALAREG